MYNGTQSRNVGHIERYYQLEVDRACVIHTVAGPWPGGSSGSTNPHRSRSVFYLYYHARYMYNGYSRRFIQESHHEMIIPERDVIVICLLILTFIHRYPLNQNCFRFCGYLWIRVSKQTHKRASTSRSAIFISWWVSCICCCRPCFYINFHAVCDLTCSNDFRDKQAELKLMLVHGALHYHLPVTWYLRLLALCLLT